MTISYERLKNFSTSIAVEKTIAEIELMLAKSGASKILKEFDEKGRISSLTFMLVTGKGDVPIKLPMNQSGLRNVFKVQVSDGKLPRKFWGSDWADEQAMRVGWRILRDWLYAQLSLLSIEMVKVEEIFLPYMYNARLGKTMFEILEQRGFEVEQLEFKKAVKA
jgi:hypothetical protein